MTTNCPELEDIRNAAIRLHLIGSTWLKYLPIDVLATAYNGTGPEFLPQRIRQKLDAACRPFLPAVMVHDVDFTFSDGSRRMFLVANQHLFWNCLTCSMHAHPWFSWRRYVLIIEAWTIYRACNKFGWIAWRLAHNKNTQKKGTTNE